MYHIILLVTGTAHPSVLSTDGSLACLSLRLCRCAQKWFTKRMVRIALPLVSEVKKHRKLSTYPHHGSSAAFLETLQRGALEVDPIQLSLTPPTRAELERWRDLAELRERTDPEGVGEQTLLALAGGSTANFFGRVGVRAPPATTTAFLRFRILPAGPFKFSRAFPLNLPRPTDWGRNPPTAGESGLGCRTPPAGYSMYS